VAPLAHANQLPLPRL